MTIAYVGEGNGCEYKVLGSSGLVTITLDKPLKKNALTDTDYDGLTNWNEVNTDLIYRICAQDPNKNISFLTKIKTSDLPTLTDRKDYYKGSTSSAKDYVERGYSQLLGKYIGQYNVGSAKDKMNKTRTLPFYSNPVDADSDNDSKALDEYKQNNSIPSFALYKFSSMEDALYAINNELNNNRSVVVKTTYHGEHCITVTGTIDGTPALCFEDFVGIDPWYNGNGLYNSNPNFAGIFKLYTNANQTFYQPYTIMTISFD